MRSPRSTRSRCRNTGTSPGRWGHSSAGRASAWHAEGQEFESPCLHKVFRPMGASVPTEIPTDAEVPIKCGNPPLDSVPPSDPSDAARPSSSKRSTARRHNGGAGWVTEKTRACGSLRSICRAAWTGSGASGLYGKTPQDVQRKVADLTAQGGQSWHAMMTGALMCAAFSPAKELTTKGMLRLGILQ